jgi:hypothetical protein
MRALLFLTCFSLLAVGCKDSVAKSEVLPAQLVPVVENPHSPIDKIPDPEVQANVGRAPRRLTVDQLRASILTTTGRSWADLDKQVALQSSLGKADFALVTLEATETDLLFAKFLEEGARTVCLETAKADVALPAAQRVLSAYVPAANDFTLVTPSQIEESLNKMALQFWGSSLSSAEKPEWISTVKRIAPLVPKDKPEQMWGMMCVAFMTDARFILY